MQLLIQNAQVSDAVCEAKECKQKLEILSENFKEEEQKQFAISMNMTRQYKLMREKLLNRIYQLDEQIGKMKEKMETVTKGCDFKLQEKDQIIEAKNKEIAQASVRNEELQQEFGQMLKQTLKKMSERIVISTESAGSSKNDEAFTSGMLKALPISET